MIRLLFYTITIVAVSADGVSDSAQPRSSSQVEDTVGRCPVKPEAGITSAMAGNGWDGPGAGSATIYWHVEGTTADFGSGQRTAMIDAMEAWASVVQIDFQELAIANHNQSVDWNFATDNHCAMESDECGDPDCPFDGAGDVLAHAGFPPGVNSDCVNPMTETWAGNVHFDDDELWELDNAGGTGAFSLTLIACHELGHALGLAHDASAGSVMNAEFTSNQSFVGLSANDIANIRAGYASGTGSVITLEDAGIWVNGGWGGAELGTLGFPFDTVAEGIAGVPPFTTQVEVNIWSGDYDETMVITQAMTLEAVGGTVVIGE